MRDSPMRLSLATKLTVSHVTSAPTPNPSHDRRELFLVCKLFVAADLRVARIPHPAL